MVEISFDLEVEGDITDAELDQKLTILGEHIVNAVKQNIRDMGLISDSGAHPLLQGWFSKAKNGVLIIENITEYADYIEFGTYSYWASNGLEGFTDPMEPKKKDVSRKAAKELGKGMQSFAPLRKVIFNESIMQSLVDEAFS